MDGALTWRETRLLLAADWQRLNDWQPADGRPCSRWHPGYLCVYFYRLSHYLHRGGHRYAARLVWHLNSFLTGSDIPPAVEIGAGLLVPCPAGIALAGKAGRNLTMLMCSGLGGEVGRYEDVGAGAGLPLVGDDVILEPHSGILGPVRVGDRTRVGAGAAITYDVAADTWAVAPPARFLSQAGKP